MGNRCNLARRSSAGRDQTAFTNRNEKWSFSTAIRQDHCAVNVEVCTLVQASMLEKQTDNNELFHIITHFTFTPQVNYERNQSLIDDVCINQHLDVVSTKCDANI